MKPNCMVVIDDLEQFEAKQIIDFLLESIDNGDLPLAVQDCMTIYPEVDFHRYEPNPDEVTFIKQYGLDESKAPCDKCNLLESDSIHQRSIDKDSIEVDE